MTSQDRKYLWNHFYARFFITFAIQSPYSLNEQYLKELRLFFETASLREIESLMAYYFDTSAQNKYGEETSSSPYHIINSK